MQNALKTPVCLVSLAVSLWLAGTGLAAEALPTHQERESIGATKETRFRTLTSFCLNREGNLLACDAEDKVIKVITPTGKLLSTWPLPFAPHRIACAEDGTSYVGGDGMMSRVDAQGKVVAKTVADGDIFPNARVSGIAITPEHVFISLGNGWSMKSLADIVRFSRSLKEAKVVAQNLRGCCQRLDLAARDGVLFVAENTRYRVVRMDAEGKVLSQWGSASREDVEGFGGCCNPMNLFFGPGGDLYTAESGVGRVKRYSPDGKFLGLVGEVGVQRFNRAGRTAAACSNVTVAITPDGSRVFVQDVVKNLIRVLVKDGVAVVGTPAAEATTEVAPEAGNKPYQGR